LQLADLIVAVAVIAVAIAAIARVVPIGIDRGVRPGRGLVMMGLRLTGAGK